MYEWSGGYVKSNGIEIHYYRTGGNKPQVVLNHGATDDGLCWTRLAKELQADYDLVMVDARGHGLSSGGTVSKKKCTCRVVEEICSVNSKVSH